MLSFKYACETWGYNSNVAELCYRSGIKVALDVRQNLSNEITYVESGKFPLECKVKEAQLKFWLYVIEYPLKYPESALNKIKIGLDNNISYLKCYKNLQSEFVNPDACLQMSQNIHLDKWKHKIMLEAESDND